MYLFKVHRSPIAGLCVDQAHTLHLKKKFTDLLPHPPNITPSPELFAFSKREVTNAYRKKKTGLNEVDFFPPTFVPGYKISRVSFG